MRIAAGMIWTARGFQDLISNTISVETLWLRRHTILHATELVFDSFAVPYPHQYEMRIPNTTEN